MASIIKTQFCLGPNIDILHKFVEKVQHITFSGPYSARSGRKILYITERCVFELGSGGPELVEIAPGLDLKRDILDKMDFRPIVREPLKVMEERIFRPDRMALKDDLLSIPTNDRIFYNPEANIMLANLAGYTVKSQKDVDDVREAIERLLKPLGKKVYAVGNYDQFSIDPELIDAYTSMQAFLMENYFERVSRYTTSAFLRIKMGGALEKRGVAPHIYESPEEAHAFLVGG
jgi:propionate CoA-transferase